MHCFRFWWCELASPGSGQDSIEGPFEHSNDTLCFIKGGQFLDQLRDCHLTSGAVFYVYAEMLHTVKTAGTTPEACTHSNLSKIIPGNIRRNWYGDNSKIMTLFFTYDCMRHSFVD
jgi:hypothetical protein